MIVRMLTLLWYTEIQKLVLQEAGSVRASMKLQQVQMMRHRVSVLLAKVAG